LNRARSAQAHALGSFFSLLESWIDKGMKADPLERYVDEQVFRYNNRKDEAGNKLTDARMRSTSE
jgi:hypothetical protein